MILYSMTLDILFVASISALLISTITMYFNKKVFDLHEDTIKKIWSRVHHLEAAMAYHDLIPLPWEMDDLEKNNTDARNFKRQGNVVFIREEE